MWVLSENWIILKSFTKPYKHISYGIICESRFTFDEDACSDSVREFHNSLYSGVTNVKKDFSSKFDTKRVLNYAKNREILKDNND